MEYGGQLFPVGVGCVDVVSHGPLGALITPPGQNGPLMPIPFNLTKDQHQAFKQ